MSVTARIVFPDGQAWESTFDLILPEPGEYVEARGSTWLVDEVRRLWNLPPAVLVSRPQEAARSRK